MCRLSQALAAMAAFGLFIAAAFISSPAAAAERLENIQRRGFLTCGVWPEVAGFSSIDAAGRHKGFDVDLCRAVSAAIFGVPDKVRFLAVETIEQFLASPDIDLVSRRLTWSVARERRAGIRFGPVTFYDGQSFLVPRASRITSVRQLSGAKICVQNGSEAASSLAPYFRALHWPFEQVLLESPAELPGAFRTGRCDAYSADTSMLGAVRSGLDNPEAFDIIAEQITKEPLAQVVRQEDALLLDVLRSTVFALIAAEEFGLTSENVDTLPGRGAPAVQRLLGVTPGIGAALGLSDRWAYHVVKTLGNYGELFERNVGSRSSIKLPRGPNRLWTDGGLMYAPPI